ncbi:hypothetical protein FF1_041934 [Malus domestica]
MYTSNKTTTSPQAPRKLPEVPQPQKGPNHGDRPQGEPHLLLAAQRPHCHGGPRRQRLGQPSRPCLSSLNPTTLQKTRRSSTPRA